MVMVVVMGGCTRAENQNKEAASVDVLTRVIIVLQIGPIVCELNGGGHEQQRCGKKPIADRQAR